MENRGWDSPKEIRWGKYWVILMVIRSDFRLVKDWHLGWCLVKR